MRKTLTALALTAALGFTASPALAMGEECTTSTEKVWVLIREASPAIPAVPPVYLTVTEYEFRHRNADLNGGIKWQTDPGWNAEDNPNSIGWFATGNTRQTVTDTVLKPGTPAVPAQEAVYEVREISLTSCNPVLEPSDPPLVPADPAPAPEVPAAQPVHEPEAPAAPVAPAVPVLDTAAPAPQAPAAVPLASTGGSEELAYTGAADWVLPAGLALLTLGAGTVALTRRRTA